MPVVATCIAALVIGSTAWGMVPDMFTIDPEPDTPFFLLPYVYSCDPLQIPMRDDAFTRNPVKWWLNCASYQWFDNYKLLPAAFGIGIMPLVYLLGSYMTNDRLVGLFSLAAFINNPLYTDWATSGIYDQTWAFFSVLSLVLVFKNKFHLSIISYLVSFAAKSMVVLYLPVYLYTLWKQSHDQYYLIIFSAVFGLMGFVALTFLGIDGIVGNSIGFHPERWEDAVFRNIGLFWQVIPFAVFIIISRTFVPKKIMPNMRLAALWMLAIFLENPLIYFFTLQDTYSYRYVPLAALMSVYVGMTIVQAGNWFVETRLAKVKSDL